LFELALTAAQAAASHQHYPEHSLYVVATPIGNLADITLRALHVLQRVDAIACEDTRHTAALLGQYGLHKPLIALHQHNEAQASVAVVTRLQAGQRVACVSDAGTPAISDPGARLVQAVRAAGLRVVPLPGASSVTTLLCAAGLDAGLHGTAAGGFGFLGFLPSKTMERHKAVAALGEDARPWVLLEAPHRMADLAQALGVLGSRLVTVGRELTKQFEEIDTMACHALSAWLTAQPQRLRGEFALVVHAAPATDSEPDEVPASAQRTLRLLLDELPLKTAARLAAEISQQPKNALYQLALRWKSEPGQP
jgi:16S rRNA (cytidine1402-2'-O)-methyltransferase